MVAMFKRGQLAIAGAGLLLICAAGLWSRGDHLTEAAPASRDPALLRYPYLTDVVGPYATVNWATDRSNTSGTVLWGVVDNQGHCTPMNSVVANRTAINVNGVGEYQWKATLTLAANMQYCYRVYLAGVDLLGSDSTPYFWGQLPAGEATAFRFAVFGDWGMVDATGANPDQARLMAQIAASGARFALTAGDNGYPSGSQNNYGDLVQVGPNLSAIFGPAFWARPGAALPLFPAPGNHGFARSDALHPHLLNWPQDQAVAGSAGRYSLDSYCCLNGTAPASYPSAWYAFDAGVARFYVLEAAWDDANLGTGSDYQDDYDYHWQASSAEYQWLAADLAAHPAGLKFAVFHYPLYSDASTEPSDTFLQGASSLEGLLSRYGVAMAFSGHAHIYQRNPKVGLAGLVSYVTGGGGATLEPIGGLGCAPGDAYGIGWNTGTGHGSACGAAPVPTDASQVFHFLRVDITGWTVAVTPIDEQGRSFDAQVYDFTPPPPSPTPSPTACTPGQFGDVPPGSPFYTVISDLVAHGAIAGYSDCTFRPYNTITRGQVAKVIVLAFGFPLQNPAQPTFQDVPPEAPFYTYVETAYAAGIITGYADGTFRPYTDITRGQLTKMVSIGRGWPVQNPPTPTFQDVPSSHPFYPYIETAYAHGIISGYGCGAGCLVFHPSDTATRGQGSKVIDLAIAAD